LINLKCFIFPNVPGLLSLTGVNNTVYGIDAMNPSSRDDFTEFGKLLKDKITQYEKSLYYASFLEALVRDVCISCK
jgi:translation initiation factor 3 subunit J